MKKTRVIILSLIVLFAVCATLVGCQPNGIVNYQQYSNKYNAVMYSTSKDWILTSFLEDNKVKGAYYKNPDYIESENDSVDKYYYDETSPKHRTFIVDNQDTYNTIFKENALRVDFNKEIVYLYIFADIYPSRKYYIDNILLEEEQVNIYYKVEKNNKNDASAPGQRCLIVVMKKTNTSNVKFVKQK